MLFFRIVKRIKQIFLKFRNIEISGKKVHILASKRTEYVRSAILCANSIWEHSPEITIVIHTDIQNSQLIKMKFNKFDRGDRISINLLNENSTWQQHKLHIILNEMQPHDIFSDSDIFWNGPIPAVTKTLIFVKENEKFKNEPYRTLSELCSWGEEFEINMFNTSVISLGLNLNIRSFRSDVLKAYTEIENAIAFNELPDNWNSKIKRLIEQLSISYALSQLRQEDFSCLKEKDRPMDGSIAESYYLGTTLGWD